MTTLTPLQQALNVIKQLAPNFNGKIALILGSGMSQLVDHIKNCVEISYAQLPGFPDEVIADQHAKLILGELSGMPIA